MDAGVTKYDVDEVIGTSADNLAATGLLTASCDSRREVKSTFILVLGNRRRHLKMTGLLVISQRVKQATATVRKPLSLSGLSLFGVTITEIYGCSDPLTSLRIQATSF